MAGSRLRLALKACASAVALLTVAAPAFAEPPMWVIEDEDSTLYLFGTVHLLDPSIEWRTERVVGALDAATEVWFEVPMPASIEQMQAEQGPLMLQSALSPGRPLSSLLSEEEKAQLQRALARTPSPAELAVALEMMKPWFATMTLGTAPLMTAGYDPAAGADIVLAGLAREQGDRILGFETIEQQLGFFTAGSEEDQLAALRAFLAVPDEAFDAYLTQADAAFRAWMAGDPAPLEAVMASWREGDDVMAAAMPYGAMLVNRNADWAGQIEALLAGEGTAFIAVGAGHLLGPDSVQAQLAARGIEANAY